MDQPIIKKVKKVQGGGHHGGAWKVAYADFVTAMMAFFLLMWLLSSTSDEQRKGLADYFNPKIPLSDMSSGGDSMFQGDTVFKTDQMVSSGSGGSGDSRNNTDAEHDETDDSVEREQLFDFLAPPAPTEVETPSETAEESEPRELTKDELDAAIAEEGARRDAQMAQIASAFENLKTVDGGNELLEHLSMRVTPEGLMIEVTETDGDPLFKTGSSEPSPLMSALMEVVAPIVARLSNDVMIVGHTDATPYSRSSRISNWELSADRANSARRLLVGAGLPEDRLQRIAGAADRNPLSDNPFAPENRRIGITLLRETQPLPGSNSPAPPPALPQQ